MCAFRGFVCQNESEEGWVYHWNQQLPIFPECEVNIVFPISLTIFSLLVLLPYAIFLLVSKSNSSRLVSCLYLCKMDLVLVCLLLNAIRVVYVVSETRNFAVGSFVGPSSVSFSLILYIIVMHYERKRNSMNSGVCFFYLLLLNVVWICACWNHTIHYIK
ncbi:unnamed protein product [Heterobilharzia americana]|nr:unnamed protein product [Heterobilharzia americana]CAH8638924.1 unnamed protein product [Heterobilharzia americana]